MGIMPRAIKKMVLLRQIITCAAKKMPFHLITLTRFGKTMTLHDAACTVSVTIMTMPNEKSILYDLI